MNPEILQSLQEIASLLLLVHDDYLKDVYGNDILNSLMALLSDVGLLEKVSILDAERLRCSVMGSSDSDMGYELFYDWLRGIGQLVCNDRDIAGKKALHSLLTKYIIPFASTMESSNKSSNDLPFFTEEALKVMVEYDEFLVHWFFDITTSTEATLSCLSCNFSLWQQLSNSGYSSEVANLAVLGNLTKYSVVPDLVTEDELESMMVLACNISTEPKEELGFAGFLSLLELVAEAVPTTKLKAKLPDLPTDYHKLAIVLIVVARNMLQRKAFSCATRSGEELIDEVNVFDDDLLASTGIEDETLLGWLRQANAIQVPHVQIPLIRAFLQALAAERSELLLQAGLVEGRRWKASTVSSVLYAIAKQLSTISATATLSEELELCYLMRQLPGLFFCVAAVQQVSIEPCLRSLYSAYTAPLLQDSMVEVNLSLHVLWTALGTAEESMEESALRSDNFIASFGTARSRVHHVLGFLQESGLVPRIASHADVVKLCGLVMCEDAASFSEDSRISQGRLLEALYCLALNNWPALENMRRRRGLSTPPSKLSSKQPQHDQQVFQTFLYLLGFHFPLATLQDTQHNNRAILDAGHEDVLHKASAVAQNQEIASEHNRASSIPISVSKPNAQSPQLPSLATEPHSVPRSPSLQQPQQVFHQLAVSFNSNRHIDGSPVGGKSALATVHLSTHSFFSEHPLRDIAVLLMHFPVSSLTLSPWTVLELLKQNSASFIQSIHEHGERPSDAQLTSLLVCFCRQYEVSADELSEFFAQYYLTEEEGVSNTVDATCKERAMRDPVLDYLLTEELVPVLHSCADTLKWEYARCFAMLRVSTGDPFAECVIVPFLTDEDCALHRCMLPSTAAVNWAIQYAGLNSNSADAQLSQLNCLTGLSTGALTFSAFTLFAVRCFTAVLFDTPSGPPEQKLFASTVRKELNRLSEQREALEQTLQLQILRPLFAGPAQYDIKPLQEPEARSALAASLVIFKNTLGGSSPVPTTLGPSVGDGHIPPRPPHMLWDAPRFVQFCRDFGILGKFSWSQCACWAAFGSFLRQQSVQGLDSWDTTVVPPIPLRVTDSLMLGLIKTTLAQQRELSQWRLFHKALVPVVCRLGDPTSSSAYRAGQDGLRVEDLLRLGGSATIASLLLAQDYLRVAYTSLTRTALSSLSRPSGAPVPVQTAELPLNQLCRFFACANILRAAMVAVQAKRSIQVRIRPVLCTRVVNRSAPLEVVTLSYSEFEEVFIRCAFLLWESSGAHTHSSSLANKAVLLSQAQFQQHPIHAAAVRAVDAYVHSCSHQNSERQRSSCTSREARTSWGVDFVLPYLEALQAAGDFAFECETVPQLTSKPAECVTSVDYENFSNEGNRKTVRFEQDCVANSTQGGDNTEANALLARRSARFLSVATDLCEHSPLSEAALARKISSSQLIPTGNSSDHSRKSFPRSPGTSSNSPQLPLQDRQGWDTQRRSRDSSPSSAKMQTSQRIILSSTERFLLQQESSQQFVVAVDALLMGTKEALWPVYATYCSCGDSLDPGKLSGPNLFTLLSKLGVLTDDTRLSAVGILLHQTAAHLLTGASVISMAVLYEAEAYYESPSLSFEEFIVFLCAFSQLRYGGEVLTANAFRTKLSSLNQSVATPSLSPNNWFKQWREYMSTSNAFRHLLQDCVLPILHKQMLLAFPEDARLRDRFCCVFSLEVLIAIEGVEETLKMFFESERQRNAPVVNNAVVCADIALEEVCSPFSSHVFNINSNAGEAEIAAIVAALKRINLIPDVMAESQVMQLVRDVLPDETSRCRTGGAPGEGVAPKKHILLFPQWEWVLSVVAFHAVQAAIEQSDVPTEAEKVPAMVADVITSIAAAITVHV